LYSKKETWKLLQYAKKNQEVIFIVAHMLGLDIFKGERKSLSNVYFDMSGSEHVRDKDIQEEIELFGYDHVTFGTDTPYARIEDQIDKIKHLNLSANEMEHIFKLNIGNVLFVNAQPTFTSS
jgi:predicted TIM-barrel fold metal-dependent hydrolase